MIDLAKFLTEEELYFEHYRHPAIFTNEDAVIMKEKQGFTGTETKSLFLKSKQGNYFVYFTFTTKRTDFKALKQLVGQKVAIVSSEELLEETQQLPGAVSPLGYEPNVAIIVDHELYQQEKLVFAPGKPDETMVILGADLQTIFNRLGNPVFDYQPLA